MARRKSTAQTLCNWCIGHARTITHMLEWRHLSYFQEVDKEYMWHPYYLLSSSPCAISNSSNFWTLCSCYAAFVHLDKRPFPISLHDDLVQRYLGLLFRKKLFLGYKHNFMFYAFEEKYFVNNIFLFSFLRLILYWIEYVLNLDMMLSYAQTIYLVNEYKEGCWWFNIVLVLIFWNLCLYDQFMVQCLCIEGYQFHYTRILMLWCLGFFLFTF